MALLLPAIDSICHCERHLELQSTNSSCGVKQSPANEKFSESFKKRYGIQPGWASSNGYDTIKLLAQAVTEHGNDNLKITQYLNTVKDFDGACGVYSSSGDNRFLLPAQMKQVRGEGFVVVVE